MRFALVVAYAVLTTVAVLASLPGLRDARRRVRELTASGQNGALRVMANDWTRRAWVFAAIQLIMCWIMVRGLIWREWLLYPASEYAHLIASRLAVPALIAYVTIREERSRRYLYGLPPVK